VERQGESTDKDYVAPVVTDYGDLVALTAVTDPVMGEAGVRDLSFSAPAGGGGGGTVALAPMGPGGGGDPGTPGAAQDVLGVADTSAGDPGGDPGGGAGGAAGGPAGGGGGGGGGGLPFTGFAPGLVAAVGTALAGSGAALRRALRRRAG
jgi:hypothetical protein